MCATMICIAAVALGIDPGWQRLDDGGWRYVIQIDPVTLDALKAGKIDKIESDIPPQLRDIRSCQILIGRGDLRSDKLPPATVEKQPPHSEAGPSASARPEVPSQAGAKPLPTFSEQVLAKPQLAPQAADTGEPSKPWLPLTIALATAVGCFAGMIYLGWIAMDYRRRYLKLFGQMADSQQT